MNLFKDPDVRRRIVLTWTVVFVSAHLVVLLAATSVALAYEYAYAGKFFPGVSVMHVSLGGLSREEARHRLEQAIDGALQNGWRFRAGSAVFTILPTTVATEDPDASRDLIRYDVDRSVARAFALGRSGSLWKDTITRFRLRIGGINLSGEPFVETGAIERTIREQLKDLLVTPKDAELHIRVREPSSEPEISVTPERTGYEADVPHAVDELERQANQLAFAAITIPVVPREPSLHAADLEPLRADVPRLLAHAPFKLQAEERTWTITSSTLALMLNGVAGIGGWKLDLDPERVLSTLKPIIKDVLIEAKEGSMSVENGRMKEFTAPVEGIALDLDRTIYAIEEGWSAGSSTITIALERTTPLIRGDAEAMGIREILGIGRSNFSRSPKNRRYNIALGAKKVHGSLVEPDAEFSLLKTLGSVNGENGWLPELVIKGNKTTPEFGGGLCQIGTTTFRAALASGVPITERRNHSYRVRYYEPAGTDATIYEPAPDMRFRNDTGHWLLITARIVGDDISFTVWGTNDGRKVSQTKPRVYNVVPPPPKKIIETLDLPPGETKCTESAHAGADASFDYSVEYPDGESKNVTFNSHYKPWGAVCLLGVAQLSAPTQEVDETGVNNPN